MDPLSIIALVRAGVSTLQTAYDAYEQIKHTMSETDQATVEAEFQQAKDATAVMRKQVDEELDDVSKK